LCKQEKSIETREVSSALTDDFHKLINICVEILIQQKYFSFSSALGLPLVFFRNFARAKLGC
jgi:hypothetical protein